MGAFGSVGVYGLWAVPRLSWALFSVGTRVVRFIEVFMVAERRLYILGIMSNSEF